MVNTGKNAVTDAIPFCELWKQKDIAGFLILSALLCKHELSYTNISLVCLDFEARIPVKQRNVQKILYYCCDPAYCNPEPLANFCDLAVVGER